MLLNFFTPDPFNKKLECKFLLINFYYTYIFTSLSPLFNIARLELNWWGCKFTPIENLPFWLFQDDWLYDEIKQTALLCAYLFRYYPISISIQYLLQFSNRKSTSFSSCLHSSTQFVSVSILIENLISQTHEIHIKIHLTFVNSLFELKNVLC